MGASAADHRCRLAMHRRGGKLATSTCPVSWTTMTESSPSNDAPQNPSRTDAQLEQELAEALGDQSIDDLMEASLREPPADAEDAPGDDAADAAEAPVSKSANKGSGVGDLKRGRISAMTEDEVFVELTGLDGRYQGVVPLSQFERKPRVGSIMDFVVQRIDESEGVMHLSREGAIGAATWDTLTKGNNVEARVVGVNKGGLELELPGQIKAFMPASQVDLHHIDDLSPFVGQKLPGVVVECNRADKKLVISRRDYLQKQRESAKKKLWAEIAVDQVRQGVVSNVVEYGAFVDLGGVDGLVHVSDLSYTRVDKPSEVVKPGDKVTVKVLKLDHEKQRISLGLKQTAPDPWETIEGRIKAGDQITGRVVRLAQFGAFVEVEEGVEGLLPISEISFRRIHKPSDALNEGDVVKVSVLQLEPARKRMTLSIKQAGDDPWLGAEHKYAKDTVVPGKVLSTTDFGAFVEVAVGVEGLVHISELSSKRVNQVTDVLTVGQEEQFKVLEVDEENRRIRLSLKAVREPDAAAPAQQAAQSPSGKQATRSRPRKPGNLSGGIGNAGGLGTGLGNLKL